jgi:hypothetical protein
MIYRYIERLQAPAAPIQVLADDFERIAKARLSTTEALAVEDKYLLILQNFFEFEQQLHRLALQHLLYPKNEWDDFIDDVRDTNRVIMNLLGAQRMYIDQVPQHLSRILTTNDIQTNAFDMAKNNEYDNSLGYRILYALRNHAQHGDFPIQSLSLRSKWIANGQARRCSTIAIAFVHRDDLVQNKALNSKVRQEIASMPNEIDLAPLVRESMSSFARLHINFRDGLRSILKESDSTIKEAYALFEKHAGRKPMGLYIVQSKEDGTEIDSHGIFLDGIERRVRLENEISMITNMEQHYVSSYKE